MRLTDDVMIKRIADGCVGVSSVGIIILVIAYILKEYASGFLQRAGERTFEVFRKKLSTVVFTTRVSGSPVSVV